MIVPSSNTVENISSIIAFCFTVESLIGELGYHKGIIDLIKKKTKTFVITTTTAAKAALDVLKIRRVPSVLLIPERLANLTRKD